MKEHKIDAFTGRSFARPLAPLLAFFPDRPLLSFVRMVVFVCKLTHTTHTFPVTTLLASLAHSLAQSRVSMVQNCILNYWLIALKEQRLFPVWISDQSVSHSVQFLTTHFKFYCFPMYLYFYRLWDLFSIDFFFSSITAAPLACQGAWPALITYTYMLL